MMQKGDLEFGDIVLVKFDPSVGHEFQDKRPAIVVQSNEQLRKSNLATVIPLTSNTGNSISDDVVIIANSDNKLRTDSVAKVHHVMSFDYSRFDKRIGVVSTGVSSLLKDYLKKHFGL